MIIINNSAPIHKKTSTEMKKNFSEINYKILKRPRQRERKGRVH
jgi:hypothetical protein